MTTGFFPRKETQSVMRPDGKTRSCHSCGLYKLVKTPKMKPYGNFKKGIMNIGEAPGESEDVNGKPWQGKAGKVLQKAYRDLGVDLFEDCININSISCRPFDEKGNNRTPSIYEIECCRQKVLSAIKMYNPKTIVLLGNIAVTSLIGHRWKKDFGGINKWRGWAIPDQDFKAWVCPVFHPSFVMRMNTPEMNTVWMQDLEKALKTADMGLPLYKEPDIKIINDLSILEKINSGYVSIDFETTGLKPYAQGHKIVSVSISTDNDSAYTFIVPDDQQQLNYLFDLLLNRRVYKMAHNMKFEDVWSSQIWGVNIKSWHWDSMQAAHEIDNRPNITGLKFQTYVNFGIVDYSSDIDKYLKSIEPKNANSMNQVLELISTERGKQSLLKYNGYDTVNQFRLAMKQMEEIGYEKN